MRLYVEHGWLCLRSQIGILLWSQKLESYDNRDLWPEIESAISTLRDTAPVGSKGGDDSGCGHDHGVER